MFFLVISWLQEINDHVDAEELKKLGFKAYKPNRQILAIEVDASIAGGEIWGLGQDRCLKIDLLMMEEIWEQNTEIWNYLGTS